MLLVYSYASAYQTTICAQTGQNVDWLKEDHGIVKGLKTSRKTVRGHTGCG